MDEPTLLAPGAWVYLVRCQNGSLYAGWTDDLGARLAAHKSGKGGAKYTRAFGVRALAYAEPQPDKSTALRREAALKKLPKSQKEALCAAFAARPVRFAVAGASQGDAVRALYSWYVCNSTASFAWQPPQNDEWAAWWAAALATAPCLLAFEGEQLLGFACAHPWRPRQAYAWDVETSVYLAPGACGLGLGGRLYGALLAVLKAQGYHTAYGVVTHPNPASDALHAALGFVNEGRSPGTGYKDGRWLGTTTWARHLHPARGTPAPVRPAAEMAAEAARILGKA